MLQKKMLFTWGQCLDTKLGKVSKLPTVVVNLLQCKRYANLCGVCGLCVALLNGLRSVFCIE